MPIYEYECDSCKKVNEVMQRITDEPLTTCPDCSGPLRKLLSASAFHLKGGGWYSDGYSSNGKNNSSSASCASNAGEKDKSVDKKSTPGTVKETKVCDKKESSTSSASSSSPASSGA